MKKTAFLLILLLHFSAFGDEIIVDWDAANTERDFATIQAAISDAEATAGDVVIVMSGTYVENINMSGKAITLCSTGPTDPAVVTTTFLDGDDDVDMVDLAAFTVNRLIGTGD